MKRATLCGGSQDGQRIVASGALPTSLVVDGEHYRLQSGRYVPEELLDYLADLEEHVGCLEAKAARLGILDHPAVRGGRSTPGPRLH
ncbi:MAG TPA: hypothetical protein VIM33_07560 [Gaiellaceae bacterium]|jgi:hypothetical protein